jgi:geranylgeranyl pyrophosphate synthase
MPEVLWPSSTEVHAAVAERIRRLLDEHFGPVADFGRRTMSVGHGVLSDHPHSFTTVLIPGTCLAAGADWHAALWPTAAAEYMMAAADLFDDVADADPGNLAAGNPGVALTAAAGLLSLAAVAVVRVTDDGARPTTAVALADLLGTGFAQAANGQAANLQPERSVDALTAYLQAAAKSGPLGSLMARLGARTATDDVEIVDLLGQFGRCLAVRSQLLNDARDAAPDAADLKADVRAGARTVPLAFAHSTGAPPSLTDEEAAAWETQERARVAAGGGLIAAQALAEAERLRAIQALDALEHLGRPVDGLRALVN